MMCFFCTLISLTWSHLDISPKDVNTANKTFNFKMLNEVASFVG